MPSADENVAKNVHDEVAEPLEATAVDKPGTLQKLINLLLLVAILIHPTQVTLKYALEWLSQYAAGAGTIADQIPGLNFTAADVLIAVILPLWLIKCLFARGFSAIGAVPLAAWLLVIAGAVSLFPFLKDADVCQLKFPAPGAGGEAVPPMKYIGYAKELIQLILYLIVTYLLFAASVQWGRTLKALAYVFLIVATVVVGYGVVESLAVVDIEVPMIGLSKRADAAESQAAGAKGNQQIKVQPAAAVEASKEAAAGEGWVVKKIVNPMDVDSTFGFKMVAASTVEAGTKSNRNVYGAFVALAVPLAFGLVLFHPNVLVKVWMLVVTLGGLASVLSGGALLATAAGMTVVAGLKGNKSVFATVLLLALAWLVAYPQLPRQNHKVILDSVMLRKSKDLYGSLPAPTTGKEIPEEGQWQQKYTEWQAALNAIGLNPYTGFGLGHYQSQINQYYSMDLHSGDDYYTIEKPAGVNYMEADSNNHYLVLAAEAGIPAALILVWLIVHFGRCAAVAFVRESDGFRKALAAGLLGSVVAFGVGSVFTVMLVRGLAITAMLVFAFVRGVSYVPPIPTLTAEE